MSLPDVLHAVHELPAPLYEVTGGEPLLQEVTIDLLRELLQLARTDPASPAEVMLETNGSLDIRPVSSGVLRMIDIKCPASGVHAEMLMDNLNHLRPTDELKFVLADRTDYEYARDLLHKDPRLSRVGAIHFIPASDPTGRKSPALSPADLADWILADRLSVRLSLQLHKIIWGPDTRR